MVYFIYHSGIITKQKQRSIITEAWMLAPSCENGLNRWHYTIVEEALFDFFWIKLIGTYSSLVNAVLYSLCIHKIGLKICVHSFLSDLVTACNKSRQKTHITNLLSKALQDNTHEMIDKTTTITQKNVCLFVIDKGRYPQEKPGVAENTYTCRT